MSGQGGCRCATLVVMKTSIHNQAQSLLKVSVFSAAIGMCLSLGGCNKALAPTFTAVGVREVEHSNNRSVIEFLVEAKNPNKEPIPLKQIVYTVDLDGVEVFSGVRSSQITLHTYSSHVFALPAVLPLDMLSGTGEVTYTLSGIAQYIPPGRLAEVLFDAEVKVPEATIELTGTINLSAAE